MFGQIGKALLILVAVMGLAACDDEYVVQGNNVSAVVQASPFRITIRDAQGNTVLTSVNDSAPLINPTCVYYEPSLTGELTSLFPGTCDAYSALHMEIGEPEQYSFTDLVFTELMQVSRTTGLVFATKVISGEQQGNKGVFTVGTNVSGVTVKVTVEPDPSGLQAMRITAKSDYPGVQNINFSFTSPSGEAFRGFGGRRDTLNQRGKELYSYTTEGMGMSGFIKEYSQRRAYGPQALFYSSRNYGFLLENPEISRFHMANERSDAWRFNVSSNNVSFVISTGDYKKNIETITAINGRNRPLPEWAKGFIFTHSAHVLPGLLEQGTGIPLIEPGRYLAASLDHLAKLEQYGIKTAAYAMESWGAEQVVLTPAERATILAELKKRNIKPMSYNRMMVSADKLQTEDATLYDQALAGGHLATTATGEPYVYNAWGAMTGALDYTKASANAFWKQRITAQLDQGSEGFMLDFGEQIRPDMYFSNGESGRTMHNKYATLGAQVTAGILDEYMAANPGREFFIFTRSNYSGRPGSAAYENAEFPGDNAQNWDDNTGLKSVLPDLLNRGLGGAYNGTTEIGGYADYGSFMDAELFTRWQQLATFIPMFRLNNSPMSGLKTPWTWPEAVEPFKATIALRERAMPYMNKMWEIAYSKGTPLWRPMWLEFPTDARFDNEMTQFMLGDRVLVAPVMDQGARSRSVALPAGCWAYQVNGQQYQGGGTVVVNAPLEKLPYFFRCGDTPF